MLARELFIYYRVKADAIYAACAAVTAFQAALVARYPALEACLLRRDGDSAALTQTWMETYACASDPDGVNAAIQDQIERAATVVAPFLDGERQVEIFSRVLAVECK